MDDSTGNGDNDSNSDKDDGDQKFLSFSVLKNAILRSVDKNAQLLFLMDCCHANGIGLPFMMNLKNGIYYLNGGIKNIPTQEIVCISASLSDQSSYSDKEGSIFTKELMNKIKEYKKKEKRSKLYRFNKRNWI